MVQRIQIVLAVVLIALSAGCSGNASVGEREANAESLLVTAAYVWVGETSSNAARVDSPKWVSDEAGSLGLVVHAVGVWQELPTVDEYWLLVTVREIVSCRVLERRKDGQVVVEASSRVSCSSKIITLGPGVNQRRFIHLSGRDAIAVRLGWEDRAPPPIFARAVLVHGRSSTRQGWPTDLPDWAVKWLAGFHAVGCEDLGTGRWIELGPDPKSLGKTLNSGNILARITSRDGNAWVNAEAVLSGMKDEDGRLRREAVTVQPVIPGNERPGTICSFQRNDDEGSYLAVVFHYGTVDPADLGTERAP